MTVFIVCGEVVMTSSVRPIEEHTLDNLTTVYLPRTYRILLFKSYSRQNKSSIIIIYL